MVKILLLILILLLAGVMAFIPHIGYAYPLHVDEWTHLTYAKTIAQTGAISFPDPFTGEGTAGPGSNVWLGYHVLMAIIQKVSGIDWLVLWRYGPSVIFMLTVFCVYIFANKQGYGLEAAFFACLIPTTGGLLGPAFMVPMALGLLFIPLSLYIAFYIKSWISYLLLFLITCFLWSMHPTTAAIQGIILLPFILINLKGSPMRSLGLLAALLLPILIALPFTIKQLLPEIGQLLTPKGVYPPPYLDLPAMLQIYGFIPLIFCFIGIMYLLKKGGRSNYGFLLALVLLLIVMLAFARIQVGLDTIFERGITTALLLIGIIAGAGLYWLRMQVVSARLLAKRRFAPYSNSLLCALSVVVILSVAIPARFSMPYYHIIDDENYRDFVWIRDNIGSAYACAAIDPWKATAFTAVTGKKVIRRIWAKQEQADDMIYRFLAKGCRDIAFLRDNRASFIYSDLPCVNPDLFKISNNTYVTDPNVSGSFALTDNMQNAGFEAVNGNVPAFWVKWSENCKPLFSFPAPGMNDGSCVSISMSEAALFNPWSSARAIWLQHVPVKALKEYYIGGWVKTENIVGQGGATITAEWKGPGNKWIGETSEFMPYVKGTSGWTYYHGKVTAPPAATICTVCLIVAGCSGTAWFDNIEFNMIND